MSVKEFTDEEVAILKINPYVKKVTNKGITYTSEFKRIFVTECEKGKKSLTIFKENGFDPKILGTDRCYSARKRWLKAFKKNGVQGLTDKRGENARKSFEQLSIEEKYERMVAENLLLKAENELLKKLEMEERRRRTEK